jgi:hypothetical protein
MSSRAKTMTKSAVKNASKQDKISRAVEMLPESALVHKVMPGSSVNWAGVLSELDEDKVDSLLVLLEQEGKVFVGGQNEEEWEEMGKEEYIDKLEDLRISMEEVSDNAPGDA